MAVNARPAVIGDLLDDCFDRVVGTPGAAVIWRVWEDAVGTVIARRAQPVRLRGRTLVVAVSSAPWMQELVLMKPTIRDALNARLPTPLVGDLFLVPSEAALPEPEEMQTPAPRRCAAPPPSPDLQGLPRSLQQSFAALLAAWRRRARAGGSR